MKSRILVASSTFPRWADDHQPAFVWEQVEEWSRLFPRSRFYVLAPHHRGALRCERMGRVVVLRYGYFITRFQKLAYPAIWQNIRSNLLLFLQVPLLVLSAFVAAWRIIPRLKISHVYSHWLLPQGLACGIASYLRRVPHSIHLHEAFCVELVGRIPFIGPTMVRFLLSHAQLVSVAGRRGLVSVRKYLGEKMWTDMRERIEVAPMGVHCEHYALGRCREISVRDGGVGHARTPRILFVGRFEEKKGLEYLVRAVGQLAEIGHVTELHIAGEGAERTRIENLVHRLHLEERVTFLGFITGFKKLREFQNADIVCVPSVVAKDGNCEGMPVVILEALAAGRIVVATRVSGADDILTDGKSGFLVSHRDVVGLADGLARALTLSASERKKISDMGAQLALQYDWSKMAVVHSRFLHELAAANDESEVVPIAESLPVL